jgi:hypothetical protein
MNPLYRRVYVDFLKSCMATDRQYHERMGELSGYSKCCIRWFRIRGKFISTFPNFFRRYWGWRHNTRISFMNLYKTKKYNHIVCPICQIKNLFKKVKYYKCKACGWVQFQKRKCNICAIASTERPKTCGHQLPKSPRR